MIECRAVRTEELDSMLTLMCEAFGLPFAPARELFYKDPYFDVEKKRVLVVDGSIASCLTIVEAPLRIGQAVVRVAGIAGVATAAALRRRGYAHRLLVETLPAVRSMGFAFAALFPFSYDYYRKLGWERAGFQCTLRARRSQIPAYSEARYVRTAKPSDHASIRSLYDHWSANRSGSWVRDAKRWTYLYEHAKRCIVYNRVGTGGYAFYDLMDDPEGGQTGRILEIAAESEEAHRGLVGYLAGLRSVRTVSQIGTLEDLAATGLAFVEGPTADSPRLTVEPGVMFRIVDLPAAVAALAPNLYGWTGDFTFTMADPHVPPDWPRVVRVHGTGGPASVMQQAQPEAQTRSINRIDGDVLAWSQVLSGFHSLADAISLKRLRAHGGDGPQSPDPALAELFPRRHLYVPPTDHF